MRQPGLDATRARQRWLEELATMARHARERYDLYRAKAYGPRPTSPGRLRELERECARAESRLSRAHAEGQAGPGDGASRG
jgi:hypothetical protein